MTLDTFSALGTSKVKFCGASCVATYRHRVLILFLFLLNSCMFWIRLTTLCKEMMVSGLEDGLTLSIDVGGKP